MRFLYKDNKLKQMKALVTVADCGSIKLASEKLNLTSGAVSSQISSLEDQMGVQLFIRQNNKIELNDVGKRFYSEVVNKLNGLDDFCDKFMFEYKQNKDLIFRIASNEFGIANNISKVLNKFLSSINHNTDSNKKIKLEITNLPLQTVTEKILNNELDLILYDINPHYHPAIEAKDWLCEDFVVISYNLIIIYSIRKLIIANHL